MKEMTKEGLETYLKIKQLKTASPKDVIMMQDFIQEYIDPKCIICKTCSAQIRFAFNRIINWGNKHNIENITLQSQPTTDIKLCECGTPLTDKRRKKCDDCKK